MDVWCHVDLSPSYRNRRCRFVRRHARHWSRRSDTARAQPHRDGFSGRIRRSDGRRRPDGLLHLQRTRRSLPDQPGIVRFSSVPTGWTRKGMRDGVSPCVGRSGRAFGRAEDHRPVRSLVRADRPRASRPAGCLPAEIDGAGCRERVCNAIRIGLVSKSGLRLSARFRHLDGPPALPKCHDLRAERPYPGGRTCRPLGQVRLCRCRARALVQGLERNSVRWKGVPQIRSSSGPGSLGSDGRRRVSRPGHTEGRGRDGYSGDLPDRERAGMSVPALRPLARVAPSNSRRSAAIACVPPRHSGRGGPRAVPPEMLRWAGN